MLKNYVVRRAKLWLAWFPTTKCCRILITQPLLGVTKLINLSKSKCQNHWYHYGIMSSQKTIPYTGSQETIRSKHPHQQDEIYQPARSCRARGRTADSISPISDMTLYIDLKKMTSILSVKWGERIWSRNFNHHLELLKEMNRCFLSSYWRMQKKLSLVFHPTLRIHRS